MFPKSIPRFRNVYPVNPTPRSSLQSINIQVKIIPFSRLINKERKRKIFIDFNCQNEQQDRLPFTFFS